MDDKVFDVSRPNSVAPDASGKPIIVGHHPIMNDPMVKHQPVVSPPAQTSAGIPQTPVLPLETPAPQADEPLLPPHFSTPLTPSQPVEPPAPQAQENQAFLPPVDASISGDTVQEPAPPVAASGPSDQQFIQTTQPPAGQDWVQPQAQHPHLTPAPISHNGRRSRKSLKVISAIVLLLVAAYLAIDAGLLGKSINLPFHIFKQDAQQDTSTVTTATPTPVPVASSTQTALPDGFVNYKLIGTTLNIPYPSVWGTPTATADMGYLKRGGTNKADSTYAYLVSFATNKDVQIAVTSAKYLPPARSALYYDFLQWCVGTADNKIYKQFLHFTTNAGVDTPSTVTCDQGPLVDATKINDTTIVQTSVKAADGKLLGDIYTRNLKVTDYPVMRVSDTTAKNGDNIKKILDNLSLATTN